MAKKTRHRTRKNKTTPDATSGGQMTDWFREEISRRTASQRLGKGIAWGSALSMAGLSFYKFALDDSDEITFDSLELQRKEGWNVGAPNKRLNFTSGTPIQVDSRVRPDWFPYLDPRRLIEVYQPASTSWQPFFVPTLIQSLNQSTLREQIRPIVSTDMRDTYERAEGLRELLGQATDGAQTLILADLPGPASVALGAALADTVVLVPAYDNWPHPDGVVHAHETLAGMVYYAHEIEEKKAQLKPGAPAMILLDSQRLSPYRDENTQFDNRYLAKIPPIDQLRERGVTNVIYLVRDEAQREELDDLNDEFVEFDKNSIGVRLLRLSDFKPFDEEVEIASSTESAPTKVRERHYYYGGSPLSHWWFYSHYGYRPSPTVIIRRGGRATTLPRPSGPAPSPPRYRPQSRTTIFSASRTGGARGVGRSRPSGFGRTSVRMSGGRVTGTRLGRSGSYGRSGGWFGG